MEVLNATLRAGELLKEAFTALSQAVLPLSEKIAILERLLAAQRRAHQLATAAGDALVNPDDLVQPLLNTLTMLADSYDFKDASRAAELRAEAERLVEGADPNMRVDYLRSIAAAEHARGEFARGLNVLEQAEKQLDRGAAPRRVARVIMDRVDILQQLGDFEAAASGVSRVRQMLEAGQLEPDPNAGIRVFEQHVERARLQFDIEFQTGLIERGRGRYDLAARATLRAAELATRMQQPPEVVRFQLARISLQRGDATGVDRWLDEAEPILAKIAPQRMPVLYMLRGWMFLIRGDAQSAAQWLCQARAGAAAVGDLETQGKASWRLAQAYELIDPDAAGSAYLEACAHFDRVRRAPLGYRLDNWYLADKYAAFVDATRWFSKRDEPESALHVIELVKSRRLTAALASAGVWDQSQHEQAAELLSVNRQLDAIAMEMAEPDRAAKRDDLEARRAALIDEMRRNDPRFRNITLPALDVRGLQQCLTDLDARALDLFMPDDATVVAVLVTPDGLRISTRSIDEATRKALDTFVANLREARPNELYFDLSGGLGPGLSNLVPQDLIDEAISGTRLLLAPHRELHVVPWAALELDGTRVCERTAVGIVPCLSCVPAIGIGLSQKPSVQFFGPPAYRDGAIAMEDYQQELDSMAANFVERGIARSRGPNQESATVSAFLNLLDEKDRPDTMLLVASHGEFDPAEPLRSKLNVTDGNVDAATIMLRRIPFEEVLLRACSTGERVERVRGLDLVGDDILGIPGALLEAGARSVIVSIPPLVRRPTTRRLFERFLAHRCEGDLPVVALAKAQRAALEDGDDAVDWAGVAVYGVL